MTLSQVLFVATANILDTIPGPLQDRMEIIRLSAGTRKLEKLEIAKQYLVKKQREGTGLTEAQIVFDDCGAEARSYAGIRVKPAFGISSARLETWAER